MDRFDEEAQYRRTLASVDTLVDMEVNSDNSSSARVSLLAEAYEKLEKAAELL